MLSSEVQELIENKEWKKNIEEDFKVEMNINLKSKEKIKVKISLKTGDIVEYIGTKLNSYLDFEMQFIHYWDMCSGKYKIENNIIILETDLYWKFYKTFTKGKDFLKEKWIINGQKCRFMTTKEMFDNNKRGVYGIYYNGELIYIGSASDYIERWKQHEEEFNNPLNTDENRPGWYCKTKNEMYFDNLKEEKEYVLLESNDSVQELVGKISDGMWIFENIEKLYIELLQPKYNIEGKNKPYVFKAINFYKEKFDEGEVREKLKKKLGVE